MDDVLKIGREEVAEADRLGVDSTPMVYVNGKPLERVNDFLKVVDREARRQGFSPAP